MYVAFSVLNLGQSHRKWPQRWHKNAIHGWEKSRPLSHHSFLPILVCLGGDQMADLGDRGPWTVQWLCVPSQWCGTEKRKRWKTEQETDGRCDLFKLPKFWKTSDQPGCLKIRTKVGSVHLPKRGQQKRAQQSPVTWTPNPTGCSSASQAEVRELCHHYWVNLGQEVGRSLTFSKG